MKKLILSLTSLLLFVGISGAVNVPVDNEGHALSTIDLVGANFTGIDGSTGAAAIQLLIVDGQSTGTAQGYMVYGVKLSSVPSTGYLVFRDTSAISPSLTTLNGSASTATIVNANDAASNSAGTVGNGFIKFPVPMQFQNGVYAVDPGGSVTTALQRWTIFYRRMGKNNN